MYAKFKFSRKQPQIQGYTMQLSGREFLRGTQSVIDRTAGVWGFSAGAGRPDRKENITDPERSKNERKKKRVSESPTAGFTLKD